MLAIHTVAAGGGSILQFDGQRLRVGAAERGCQPRPGQLPRGGPPTVTDANVLLGKIQPAWFPQVFGPAGDEALSQEAVRPHFDALARAGPGAAPSRWPRAAWRSPLQQMANAIKKISVARGYDVTRYTLQCFGGAGGQHACRVADALGMEQVFVHPLAGVLSAYGMGAGGPEREPRAGPLELPLAEGCAGRGARDAGPAGGSRTGRTAAATAWQRGHLRTCACTCATPAAMRRCRCRLHPTPRGRS